MLIFVKPPFAPNFISQLLRFPPIFPSHMSLLFLQINRDPASLIALIAVKPDYPSSAPVFCLNLHWRGEHNLGNSENIRDLERLINTSFSWEELLDLGRPCQLQILSLQLKRLLTSLDVLLEAWNVAETGEKVDFRREKPFLKPIRLKCIS